MISRFGFGTAQVRPGTSLVQLAPGERLVLGMGVSSQDAAALARSRAFAFTNYGSADPGAYRTIEMARATPADDHDVAFQVTLGPATVGTYVATGYLEVGATRYWATEHGVPDLAFRVSPPGIANLYVRQVPLDKANARADSTDISTIDDMLDDLPGRNSLAALEREGVNCVWVQTPYRVDFWSGQHELDTAGSDYASTDWFAIDPELSLEAREVPAWDLDRQRLLANGVMKRFVREAHQRGMRVIFGIAPNHVGHNYIFRDELGETGEDAVSRRDYRRVVVGAHQLAEVDARLRSSELPEEIKNYAEWMLPQMYAARHPDGSYNPFGASSVHATYSPDWYGVWADTKHLNHGGHAGQRVWIPTTLQNIHVLDYIGRAMLWAVTVLGIDGFRIDHALGMPYHFFQQTLPWIESEARKVRGADFDLLIIPEDHDRKLYSRRVSDVLQSKRYEELLHALTHRHVDGVWDLYNDPHYFEFVGTGNHDEVRGSRFFPNLYAYGNAVITLQLMGGPMTMLAGDEYGEGQQLRFKAKGGVPTLWQARMGTLPAANRTLAYWIARGGLLRKTVPALSGAARWRLELRGDGDAPPILAAERGGADQFVVVVSNLDGAWQSGSYALGPAAEAWVAEAPERFLQVYDLLGTDPKRPLWRRPLTGSTLLNDGIHVGLQAYQVQVLTLARL